MRERLRRRPAWAVEFGRVLRFGLVGGTATLTYLVAALISGEVFHLAPLVASTVGLLASCGVSYIGHCAFSFRVASDHRLYLPRFLVMAVIAYVTQLTAMAIITDLLLLPYQYGVAAVVVMIPLVNYAVSRLWVFGPGLRPRP